MMELFRRMVNECVRIGIQQKKTSMKSLSLVTYPYLKVQYGNLISPYYRLCANSRATGILSTYRKSIRKGKQVKVPHCSRRFLSTCYKIRIHQGNLLLPQGVIIRLNDYVLKKVAHNRVRSVTLSVDCVSIVYSIEMNEMKTECSGVLGADFNCENITYVDALDNIKRLPMDNVANYKIQCRKTKSHFKRNDVRIGTEIFGKYGKLQADKTMSEIHKHTSRMVRHAKKYHLAIAIEDKLDKMQGSLYRKGNSQGRDFIFKLNSWARGEAKRQLEYKGKREGVLVFTVNPRGTSAKCSKCGNRMIPEENRMLYCTSCGLRIDRDSNAAINIRNRGLEKLFSMRFKPVGLSIEAMKGNPMKKLTTEVILRADGSQVDHPNG